MSVIRIALTDDHFIFRIGLKKCLESFEDVQIVLEASNGKDLLEQLTDRSVDIVLMDVQMPVMNGVEATRVLKDRHRGIKVLALSASGEEETIINMIRAGADGYLAKSAAPDEIVQAITHITETGCYFNKYVSAVMARNIFGGNTAARSVQDDLNLREKEVLKLVCEERTNVEIAQQLFVSPRTVEGYRSRLIEKSGAKNIAGLVLFAIKLGIIRS
jgi:DNA-binding NarL/FixJ family response regulator